MKKHSFGWIASLFLFWAIGVALTFGDAEHFSSNVRHVEKWVKAWKFHLGDVSHGEDPQLDDSSWRALDLPHDWSIEGEFSKDHPATPGGGALPGGIGWYRKTFFIPEADQGKRIFVDFDGIYRNSEVWINGHYLGKRPYGYSSFRYELTPYLYYGTTPNVIAVRVDNSQQPNSRWYSGSGIYRNVWLVKTSKIHVDHWGTFVTTPSIDSKQAQVSIQIQVRNATEISKPIRLETVILDPNGKQVAKVQSEMIATANTLTEALQYCTVKNPKLWSLENPFLYTAVTFLKNGNKTLDEYHTPFGIRYFVFDREKGFFLNGQKVKINGVCNHHDLGCLGAAIHTRAIERQLEILKAMGCNAIRTSHNPPAPELLDLCDRMGFLVMDEAFDMWRKKKTEFDYAMDFDQWYRRDLEDMVLRDRNHPSVIIWSIGNEVIEQWEREDTTSVMALTKELVEIVKRLDSTRPVTSGCNNTEPWNPLFRSGALDLIGFNYSHKKWHRFLEEFPGQKLIVSEAVSAWATRGTYNMPSDSVMNWPFHWDRPFTSGNPDFTCSAYDNCHAPWGTTQEETWRIVKNHDFISGMFIWSGFDYLGEPAPYYWPARSSYFGIIDLAGFPKDVYYMYQSEWTRKPMLYIFPHWNWKEGDTVDVWAYTNLKTVELFLNGMSLGKKTKEEEFHLMWRVPFVPGVIRAIATDQKGTTLEREINTAGPPEKIELSPDRAIIHADGFDLSFITVKVTDEAGHIYPHGDQLIYFDIQGPGKIVGVDNGYQASHEPFKANYRKAYHGLCLVVVQSFETPGEIVLTAKAEGLESASVRIQCK